MCLCGCMCELKKEREKTVRKEKIMNGNVNIALQLGNAFYVVVIIAR